MKILSSRSYVLWLIYTILWGMVWGYPVFTALIVAVREGTSFSWGDVLHVWAGIFPFFLLFLLHRLPVRYLFLRQRVRVYVFAVMSLLCLFGFFRYYSGLKKGHAPFIKEYRMPPCGQLPARESVLGKGDADIGRNEPDGSGFGSPDPHPLRPARHGPVIEWLPKPLLLDLVMAALMLGFDLAIALLSRYQEEQEKARRLEAAHLRHELEHLKAQVNPHFFMNMLNNIHGMVELDPTKAQVMIMELSKLMRYVLYEGSKPRIPLCKEIDFIAGYVELMRKRYSDRKVRINLILPEGNGEHVFISPLLLISIIENAFKHGISYQNPSFVEIRLYMEEGMLHFNCTNSIHRRQQKNNLEGGVGLANLRQRLQLLYSNGFTLDITEKDGTYQVKLIIPSEYDTDTMHSC